MNVLGLTFFHPGAAAAIVVDGRLVACAEEERFNRVKFSAGLPLQAIDFCLRKAGLTLQEIDTVAFARSANFRVVNSEQVQFQDLIFKVGNPYDRYRIDLKFINLRQVLARHFEVPIEKLRLRLLELDHHRCHMLAGFLCSPFDEALVISCDGFGDFTTLRIGIGRGTSLEVLQEGSFPNSLGMFYTTITQFLGFRRYGDEVKAMGLSTFGRPEFAEPLRRMIFLRDGEPTLDLSYINADHGVATHWFGPRPDIPFLGTERLIQVLGQPRHPEEEISARHEDMAASLQAVSEEIVVSILHNLEQQYSTRNLVLTGGFAYNSLLNNRIPQITTLERVYVPPAPGNNGLCIGAALGAQDPPVRFELRHSFWGTEYASQEIQRALADTGLKCTEAGDSVSVAASELGRGESVAWFQGRMEFGPRSLGSRCILVNPLGRNVGYPKVRDDLKPFGISILEKGVPSFFESPQISPFMSFMGRIRPAFREALRGVLLNDYCRYQTVGEDNHLLYPLLRRFQQETGLPFLINTSLNLEGEPIVESPRQLLDCLEKLNVSTAVLGDFVVQNHSVVPQVSLSEASGTGLLRRDIHSG